MTPTVTATPTRTPTPPGGFSGIVHYHLDHLGSVHLITNPDGSVFEYIRYRPYGEARGHYDANGNQQPNNTCSDDGYCREFTGYDSEPVSGLQYAGARFYDPALGMFVTHDPARQFASPYAYGPWNPVNGTDPTGTIFGIDDAIFWGVVIAGVLAGAAASGIQAAVNGASIGDAFKAAAIGAAIGGVSAPIGAVILQPALGVAIGALTGLSASTASDVATAVLFTSSLAQASYGISQNDYSGIIGLGVAIGTGYAFARPQGANGQGGSTQRADGVSLEDWEDLYDAQLTPASSAYQTAANPYTPYDQPLGDPQTGQIDLQVRVKTSAYDNCKLCTGKSPGDPKYGIGSSGYPTAKGAIAADPRYYRIGTRVDIPGYGPGTVVDTGGAIKGPFRMDLWFPTHQQALIWGRQELSVTVRIPQYPFSP